MADVPVPSDVREAVERLRAPKPMRRGSVTERYMKCGQQGCRCHEDAQARHGPYYTVTRGDGGQTRSRYLSADQAAVARQQVAAGQQFREQVAGYWEACERWADAHLDATAAASGTEAVKKKGSKRASTRKSRPRSRRS